MYTNYKTHSKLDFNAGQYVGIQLCYLSESALKTTNPQTLYTPNEVFKVKSVRKGIFSFRHLGVIDEVVLETPDHQTGLLIGASDKEKIGPTYSTVIYTWTLDESLVSWIERDLGFSAVSSGMLMKLFDSTADVQKAIQERNKCKTEHTIQQEILKRTPRTYKPLKPSGPSEAEIDDLFYKN